MKKLAIATALSAVFTSAQAYDSETVYVVLTHKPTQTQTVSVDARNAAYTVNSLRQRDESEVCVEAGNTGGQWCLPVRNTEIKMQGQMVVRNGNVTPATSKTIKPHSGVTLERYGMSNKEVVETLMATGLYENAGVYTEVKRHQNPGYGDVNLAWISQGPMFAGPDYNQYDDEFYNYQRMTNFRVGDSMMSSGIASVMARGKNQNLPPAKMFVIDSEFSVSEDVVYNRGVNMVYSGQSNRFNAPDDVTPVDNIEECLGHGLSVAGIMGAERDNGKGISGIAGESDITAIRTMKCGTGDYYDTHDANAWLGGLPVEGREDVYEGTPGVVNMSLGGYGWVNREYNESPCGDFTQEAVDASYNAGMIVVTAAGNDNLDISAWNDNEFILPDGGTYVSNTSAPSSCNNVINVAAMDEAGQLASFSNYGDTVDVVAPGVWILTEETPLGDINTIRLGLFSGTSGAAPVVSGLIAETKRHFPELNFDIAELLIKQTAFDPTLNGSPRCEGGKCGAGRIDGEEFFLAVEAWSEGRLNTISHALAGVSEDEQEWYLDNFDASGQVCESYQVDFFNGHSKIGDVYKVVSGAKGADFTNGSFSEVGTYTSGSVVLTGINPDSADYAFQVCSEDGDCGDEFYKFDTQAASSASRPTICNS